jgi:hypothetical protein
MMDERTRKRLYSEKEIGDLIQRATRNQEDSKEHVEHGLSFEEIERIAKDIGISAQYLRAAAAELENDQGSGGEFRFWGGPFVVEQKRVVEGTVTDEQWEQIVLALRRATGSSGKISGFGQVREWSRAIKDINLTLEETRVSVSPREDQTTFEIRKQFRGGAFVAYSLSAIFSLTVAGVFLDGGNLSDLMNTVVAGSSTIGGLALARASLSYWIKRQRQKINRLTDWLHDAVSHSDYALAEELQIVPLPNIATTDEGKEEVAISKTSVKA